MYHILFLDTFQLQQFFSAKICSILITIENTLHSLFFILRIVHTAECKAGDM